MCSLISVPVTHHLELPHVLAGADHGDQVEAVVEDGEAGDSLAQRAVIVTACADHVSEVIQHSVLCTFIYLLFVYVCCIMMNG